MMLLNFLISVRHVPLEKRATFFNKDWTGCNFISGKRLNFDISSIQGMSFEGSKFLAFRHITGFIL
jgi:hypothetical protein